MKPGCSLIGIVLAMACHAQPASAAGTGLQPEAHVAPQSLPPPVRPLGCRGFELEAHRGHPEWPESSPSAFIQAITARYNGVETDARLLADGTWVLHHDPMTGKVVRLRTGSRRVASLSYQDWVDGYYLDREGRLSNEQVTDAVTILSRAAAALRPGQRLNIELKSMNCEQLQRLDAQLASFLPRRSYGFSVLDQIGLLQCLRRFNPESYVAVVQGPHRQSMKQWLQQQASREPQLHEPLQSLARHPLVKKKLSTLRFKNWMTPESIRELRQLLGQNFDLHVDYRELLEDPGAVQRLRKEGVKLMTYAVSSPAEHLKGLRTLRRRGALPDGAIVDSTPAETCRALKLEP